MSRGFDLHEELAEGVRDAAGAWRFIRRFADSYTRPVAARDGYDDGELRMAEGKLGFPLPASLYKAYSLIGQRNDLTRMQDRLLTPRQVHVDVTGQVVVFRVENQNCAQWGFPLAAVGEPDPPVVLGLQSLPSAEWTWRPFLDRVSLTCVEMVLSEWLLSNEAHADNRALDEETIGLLEQRFHRLPMPDYPLWAGPDSRPVRWFSGSGAILRDDAETWLWVGAASAEGIAAAREALPGEWLLADE